MVKRKLVKQGAATMMISLPSKWIKENKLEKGDEVELEEQNNSLTIALNSEGKIKKAEITIHSSEESSIRTILTNIYRQGYDSVKINFKDKNMAKIIESIVSTQLLGFEIIKKTQDSCLIENITEPAKDQFDNIFSKLIANIDEILDLTKKALLNEKFEDFKTTEEKIKQFDNFCRRLISKQNLSHEDVLLSFHQELIHAQRNLYYLLLFLSKHKVKSGKPELLMFEDCKKMFELLKQAYYTKKLEIIESMHELEVQIYPRAYSLISKPASNSVIIHNLINASRGFYLASSPLTVLALGST